MERRQGGGWVPALATSPQCGQNRAAQGVGLSLSFQQVLFFFHRWRTVRSSTRRPSPHLPSAVVAAADRQVPRSLMSRPTPMAPADRPFDRMDAQHLPPGGGGGPLPARGDFLTWWNLASVCRCRREGEGCRLSWVPPTRLLSNPSFRCIVQQGLFWLRLAPPMTEARLFFLKYFCCTRTLVLSCAQARENVLEQRCDAAIATLSTGTSPDPQVALWASR